MLHICNVSMGRAISKSDWGNELFKLKLQLFFMLYLAHHISALSKPQLASQEQTSSSYPKPLPRNIHS